MNLSLGNLIVHFQITQFSGQRWIKKKKKTPFKLDMTTIFVYRFMVVLEFFTILLPVQHLEWHTRVSGFDQHRQPDHRHLLCTVRRNRMGKFTNSTINSGPWLILKTYRWRWHHSRVQGCSAYFSYQRYQMGVDPSFVSSFEADQFGTYEETQNNSSHESPFNKQMSGV